MRKRSALPPGWTDFTFCYRGVPLAVECKIDDEEPRKDQAEMHGKLKRNGWVVLVVRSLAELQSVFRRIDSSLAGNELTVTAENAESRDASAD